MSAGSVGSLTFVGNATMLLRLGSVTVLTDPNFLRAGQRAYLGYGLWSKRLRDPSFGVRELPALDAVLLSHLHGDHLDRVADAGLPRDVPVLTTPQAARTLSRRGRTTTALRVWQETELRVGTDVVRITALPGRHGPGPVHRLLPAVMGSLIDLERDGRRIYRMYVSGDTLLVPALREIVERFQDIDLAVLHLGGTKLLGLTVTMDGRQGAVLSRLVDPRQILPVHYDDYTVFRSPLSDFTARVQNGGFADRLVQLARGGTYELVTAAAS